jgi:phosphoribosylformylglycinamidine synthase
VLVDGAVVVLLGDAAADALAGSRWAAVHDHVGGVLPALDLDAHRRLVELVRSLVAGGDVVGVHDVSDGGLAVALAEMAIRGGVGCRVAGPTTHGALFSEAPSRVLLAVETARVAGVLRAAADAGVGATELGTAGGDRLVISDLVDLPLARLTTAWRDAIPLAVAGDL